MSRIAEVARILRSGFGHALGLARIDNPDLASARAARIDEVAALWPLAWTALTLAPAAVVLLALAGGSAGLALAIAPRGLPAILFGALAPLLLRPAAEHRLGGHGRVALLAVGAAVAGASLAWMLDAIPLLASLDARVAARTALVGGVVAVVVALGSVRAALLAFTVALGLVSLCSIGPGVAALCSLTAVTLLALALIRVARREHAALLAGLSCAQQGRLAVRLVSEYEAQGSGWFWETDRAGALTYLSPKVARELGGGDMGLIGARLTDLFRVDGELVETERTLNFHLSSRTSFMDYPVRATAARADARWWSISGKPVVDELGRFRGFIGWGADLTAKRRTDAEITRLALFDGLTGLANRQRMRVSLDQTLQGAGVSATGLFLLDLDRFKAVNDTLGHQIGDALLKQVAHRLQRAVGEAGLVGRIGGDEFQVVLPREGNREVLAALADEVIEALSQPYLIDGSSLSIGCSIGIAIAPEHGSDSETLIRNADLALYAAKANGRGVHGFYRDALLAGAQNRRQLEDDLRAALAGNQFHLAYQPVVSTTDVRIVGYEALLRWDHPLRGLVSPAEFVPVAEDIGLIAQIGEWVLRTACFEAAAWPHPVRVAVNVSPLQFANPGLPAIVTSAIAAAGLSPGRLELEITEGVFLDDTARAEAMFKALKGLGVRLALDDFGTGYSSLGYLKKAPFDKIKIDQSFVRGAIQPGNRNAAIIRAIVTLADTLGMETTAEGVEQQDEIALIRDLGCSHIQGFVYGRPARAADVRAQLAELGDVAEPIGHRVSRQARLTTFRSARVELGGRRAGEARIRNISSGGVMIDGVQLPPEAVGIDVLIELLEGELVRANVRWTEGGKAGLAFAEPFNLERLNQETRPVLRRAAR